MQRAVYFSDEEISVCKSFLPILGRIIFDANQAKKEEELDRHVDEVFKDLEHSGRVFNNGNALATPTEEQMQIKLDGVSITNKPRADGRYQGYVYNGERKQYFYGRTYETVARKIKDYLEGKIPQKKVIAKKNNSPLFGEFVAKWLELYKMPNLKPKSLESLQNALHPALKVFENKSMATITNEDVQALLVSISSSKTRSLCKMHLTAIFKKALVKNLIKHNPCDAVEIKRHKSKHIKALTPDEQRIVFAAASNTKYSLLFRFLTATGLRIGEALALYRSDIDFENCTVSVTKNVVFVKGKRIEQDTPKTEAGNRTVPVPENLCRELQELGERPFPFTYDSAHCAIKRIETKTGVHVTLHMLRHTYATRLEESGIPPKVKQYLLGHASIEMTQNKYTDIQAQFLESLSDRIRNIFKD